MFLGVLFSAVCSCAVLAKIGWQANQPLGYFCRGSHDDAYSSFLFFQQASPQRQAVLAQSSGSLVVTYRPVAFLGKCACLAVHSLNVSSVLLQVCWLLTSPLNIKHRQISNRCTEKHIALPCSGDAVHLHYLTPPSPPRLPTPHPNVMILSCCVSYAVFGCN